MTMDDFNQWIEWQYDRYDWGQPTPSDVIEHLDNHEWQFGSFPSGYEVVIRWIHENCCIPPHTDPWTVFDDMPYYCGGLDALWWIMYDYI